MSYNEYVGLLIVLFITCLAICAIGAVWERDEKKMERDEKKMERKELERHLVESNIECYRRRLKLLYSSEFDEATREELDRVYNESIAEAKEKLKKLNDEMEEK